MLDKETGHWVTIHDQSLCGQIVIENYTTSYRMENKLTVDEWKKSLENMDFEHYSVAIKDKILEGDLDDLSKRCFSDCFDYVMSLYKSNKPLEVKLLKIYLEEIKGYKNITFDSFVKTLCLLSFCGFNMKYSGSKM